MPEIAEPMKYFEAQDKQQANLQVVLTLPTTLAWEICFYLMLVNIICGTASEGKETQAMSILSLEKHVSI